MNPNFDNLLSKYSSHMGGFFVEQLQSVREKIEPIRKRMQPLLDELEPLLKDEGDILALLQEMGIDPEKEKNKESAPKELRIWSEAPVYNPAWSVIEKAVYLTQNTGFLTLSSLCSLIMKAEPNRNVEDVRNNLSVSLSQDAAKEKTGKNRLKRRINLSGKWEYMAK